MAGLDRIQIGVYAALQQLLHRSNYIHPI